MGADAMLWERETEVALVRTALRGADEGRPALLLLTGPLGIGRTALLQHLPELVAGEDVRVLRANAAPMEADFAFGVVRQLFDSLLAGAPEAARERWLRDRSCFARLVFADETAPAADGRLADPSEAVLHGLRTLLANVSADSRLLVLVDDLQWADTPSLRWLGYLAKRLHGLRAVVVCTVRDGDARAEHPLVREIAEAAGQVLRPGPLSLDAVGEVVCDQFGEPGDGEFVRACHEISAGNPVLLGSVLPAMAVTGSRPTADQAGAVRALRPAKLRDRLASCLRTQPLPVRNLAAAIAVFEEQDDPELIARLAGLDTIGYAAALRSLRALGLLAARREPRFVHRVVCDAVESFLTMAERETLHDTAAALLYGRGRPAEEVAAQLMSLTVSRHPWSMAVLRTAADTALRRGAPDSAARYLRRALLDSAAQSEERARLLIDLATAERAFDRAACERHISQAVPLLTTAWEKAAAVLRISPTLLGLAPSPVVELLRQVADDLGAPDALGGTAREMALRLEARLRHCGHEDPAELNAAVGRLRAMGDEPPLDSGAERELAAVLLNAAILTNRLSAASAARLANRILEREPATSARVHSVLPLVVLALSAADSVQGIDSWLCLEQRTRRQSVTVADALIHVEQAMVLLARGRPAEARERAERAAQLAAADWHEIGTIATVVRVAVALELRDPALSEQILLDIRGHRRESLAVAAMMQTLTAAVDAQSGRLAGALEGFLASGRRLEAVGWRNPALFAWRPWAISLHHRLGDARAALALAEEEHARAEEWGAPATLGRALRLKAALHSGSEGVILLRQAVGVLRGSADELELARTLTQLGNRLGGVPEAGELLREADALALGCGAPWLSEKSRDGRSTAPAQQAAKLTRSELRVTAFVSRGLTNQEIADELGVSSRAIEKHLTNSYRKLGVSGRRELVEALADQGSAEMR